MEDKAASAMDDLKELKENIRLRVRKLRDEISDEEVLERSREIFRKITSTEAYRKAASENGAAPSDVVLVHQKL